MIIADIDGTLITNAIDFPSLKRKVASRLMELGIHVENPLSHVLSELVSMAPDSTHQESLWFDIEEAEKKAAEQSQTIEYVTKWLALAKEFAHVVGLTNNSRTILAPILKRLGVLELLDSVRYREDVQALKPDPSAVLDIQTALSFSKDKTVLVGDSWVDAETARRASVRFVSVHNNLKRFAEHNLVNISVLEVNVTPIKLLQKARVPKLNAK